MAKVKGYYNTVNGVFLGNMVAVNEATKVMSTPRYVEGVCFGEYDTDSGKFVPLTNPVIIPKGSIVEQDDRFNDKGELETHISGYVVDEGADIARKGSVAGFSMKPSNVETRDAAGNPIDDSKIFKYRAEKNSKSKIEAQVASSKPEKTETEKPKNSKFTEARPTILSKENLPEINWNELF